MEDFAIKVENVSKTFKLPHEKQSSIKSIFINAFRSKKGYELQKALNNVSFEVKKGEFFGIVGRNGSGKSTLLKLLAGIYTPTSGQVHVRGTLTPFIELGVGFNQELTGRENVFLNGSLLGFNRKEMQKMYKDIVEFAELERFMDQKLKNYSSGMQVRLAFSIAIRAKGDILLLDEVLAVGDEAFQQKCYKYFRSLKHRKQTVVLVTHDMSAVEKFCDRAMLIEKGKIVSSGNSLDIAQMYRDLFTQDVYSQENDEEGSKAGIKNRDLKTITYKLCQHNIEVESINGSLPFSISVEIKGYIPLGKCAIGLEIANAEGLVILSMGLGGIKEEPLIIGHKSCLIEFNVLQNVLNSGTYILNSTLQNYDEQDNEVVLFQKTKIKQFRVNGLTVRQHAVAHTNFTTKIDTRAK